MKKMSKKHKFKKVVEYGEIEKEQSINLLVLLFGIAFIFSISIIIDNKHSNIYGIVHLIFSSSILILLLFSRLSSRKVYWVKTE